LEDLQQWQDEIPNLPFQPDEELILDKIINNAQEFRSAVAPYCNPVMATADEAETQRFYLRKIEGAEILLAYETNFFRQELHKWSPVAPEPPPVLESSRSTRKPRPTKLQKLMAQHGVDDPEALPQNLRTKPHQFKRKSSEPSQRPQPLMAHHPLQPAPDRPDAGPSAFPSSASMNHHGHPAPVLSGLHDGNSHAHPSPWGTPDDRHPPFGLSVSPRDGPREAFAPHAFLHNNGLPSPGFGGPISPRQTGSIFNDRGFGGIDVALAVGSPIRDTFASSQGLPPPGSQDVAQMFNDLTNQGEEEDGPTLEKGHTKSDSRHERDREAIDTKWDGEEDINMLFDAP
jgi:histone demethylase JARID1